MTHQYARGALTLAYALAMMILVGYFSKFSSTTNFLGASAVSGISLLIIIAYSFGYSIRHGVGSLDYKRKERYSPLRCHTIGIASCLVMGLCTFTIAATASVDSIIGPIPAKEVWSAIWIVFPIYILMSLFAAMVGAIIDEDVKRWSIFRWASPRAGAIAIMLSTVLIAVILKLFL